MRSFLLSTTLSLYTSLSVAAIEFELPINTEDFGQPDWVKIIEAAFPPWSTNVTCPRMDKVGGALMKGYETFPEPQQKKFNPCYYTKAFAGLDPMLGGYPTPIDTKYPYEFAAPFFKQPGDGSTHHCPLDSAPDTQIQTCPKIAPKCDGEAKDCNRLTNEFRIGHVPPFVPLAAIKNAYNNLDDKAKVCDWFNDKIQPCSIPVAKLDELVYDSFVTNGTEVQFTPPKILENLPASDPKSTYYKLEYLDDAVACADNNCRGPHYCSKAAADEDIWGDFCPYIHTGDNAGLYRHPHIALAALELWFASRCNDSCTSTWLDSPNGASYGGDKFKSTSITWAEMDDNQNQIAQPVVPYKWPNSGDGLFPGHELYINGATVKQVDGSYVTKYVGSISGTTRVSVIGFTCITVAVTTTLSLL